VTLREAVQGTRRAALEALRDDLAASIEVAELREKAPLVRQLVTVLEQLDTMPAAKEASPVDDLAAARAARRAAASAQ